MRIALIGAPTSGKSQLARALQNVEDVLILDGFDHHLRQYELPMGKDATFREALVMHTEQYRQEIGPRRFGHSFVSCGTGVERVAHALVRYQSMAISTSEAERKGSDIDMIGAEMLAALMIDGMVYDHVVYLPLVTDPPPGSDGTVPAASSFEAMVDEMIRQTMIDFGISAVWLEGTTEERLASLLTMLNESTGASSDGIDESATTELPD